MSDNTDYELPEEEKAKLVAEELKLKAEEAKLRMDIELMEADKTRILAEATKLQAEAKEATAKAHMASLEDTVKSRMLEETQASDRYHRRYRFNDQFNDATVEQCMDRLAVWHRLNPGEDIEITINSEGGNAIDGMELYGYLQELKKPWIDEKGKEHPGHKIITGARGLCASMGAILLQVGDERWMDRVAYLLLHQPSGTVQGKTDEAQDTINWLKALHERMIDVCYERVKDATKNGTATKPFTRDALKKGMVRKDWMLDSTACLEGGLVDCVKG